MPTVARLWKSGEFRITGQLDETKPPVLDKLLAHFPFDGSVKPAPHLIVNRWNAQNVSAVHPVHGDLFKVSRGTVYDVPQIVGARYVVVEFDVCHNGANSSGMWIGFLTADGTSSIIDLYENDRRVGLNAWASQFWGPSLSSYANQRVRVTYVIDTANLQASWCYFNGTLQTFGGTTITGSRTLSAKITIGNGHQTPTSYVATQYWGNMRIYTIDPEATALDVGLSSAGDGVFVGQQTTNLAMSNGVRTWNFNGGTDGTETAVVANQRYRFTKGATASNTRMYFQTSYLTGGQSYALSLKWRPISSGATFNANDWCDTALTSYSNVDMGDYYQMMATGVRATYDSVYRFMDFNMPQGATVEIWDVQLEKSFCAAEYTASSRGSGSLKWSTLSIPTAHTISCRKWDLAVANPVTVAVVKNGSTFKVYQDGVDKTADWQNKWRIWAYHRDTVNSAFSASDNVKALKYEAATSPAVYSQFNTVKEGYYARTFVYSNADVRIWHRYAMDNYGRIRVNGRDEQSCGGWDWKVNPDVYIDLKLGWNVVELWGMDGDSGGTVFSLVSNSGGANANYNTSPGSFTASVELRDHANVLFMTAEAPVDFWNNTDKLGYTHGVNARLFGLSVYQKALSDAEVKALAGQAFSLNQSGNFSTPKVVELEENHWPDPEVEVVLQPVRGGGTRSIGTDDGRYYQNIVNGTYTYTGYDVTTLESGAWYIVSGEFWRSAGSTITSRTIIIEQAAAVGYHGALFSDIPEGTWTRSEAMFQADASVRILVYPTGGTAGTGTVRWRNMAIRKLPTKPMSASPTITKVGELVES